MKNRKRLLEQSLFDLLHTLNTNMMKPASGVNVCIYNGLGRSGHSAQERRVRCDEYGGRCSACIAAYLEEE